MNKWVPKSASKKGVTLSLKWGAIPRSGGPWSSSLACALFEQETVVRAAVEALFEHLAEKSEMDSKWVQKANWIAESLQQKLNGLLKIVDCWKLKQRLKQKVLKQLLKLMHEACDLTRPGPRPGEFLFIRFWSILFENCQKLPPQSPGGFQKA